MTYSSIHPLQVVQAPLSEPSMVSWEPLFSPSPGTAVKDMDVVGDHCVLVARTPANEFVLIVIPMTQPKAAYTVKVSVCQKPPLLISFFCFSFFALMHSSLIPSYLCNSKLPPWACAIENKRPGLADKHSVFEFLISSPVHPPVPYCLYPEDGLLLSCTEDGPSPEKHSNYITTRLEACSQVRTLDI